MKKRPNPWNPPSSGFNEKKRKADPFYRQNRWTVASRSHRAAHPKCSVQSCTEMVSTVPGAKHTGVTDHIIPLEQGGAGFDKRNYMSLCHSHHNKKSRLEQIYGILYECEQNEKGKKIPIRDDKDQIIPCIGRQRGGEFIFK